MDENEIQLGNYVARQNETVTLNSSSTELQERRMIKSSKYGTEETIGIKLFLFKVFQK